MKLEVHVHVHHSTTLDTKVDKILSNQEKMMAAIDILRTELQEVNATTNELATDVDDLIGKVGEGSLSAAEATEVTTKLQEIKAALQNVASKHTPGAVVDPPVA